MFSSLGEDGWIHSVPVWFLYAADQVRFLADARNVKTRNVERTGQGTLCVEVTEPTTVGTIRKHVSVAGPVTVYRPPEVADLRALTEKYDRQDQDDAGADEPGAVMIVIATQRWIAWADWD